MPVLSPKDVRLYLVAYDVSRQRTWRRVYARLSSVGEWTQLSLFVCRLRPAAMAALEAELAGLIDPASDRMLIVDLGESDRARQAMRTMGRMAAVQPPPFFLIF